MMGLNNIGGERWYYELEIEVASLRIQISNIEPMLELFGILS